MRFRKKPVEVEAWSARDLIDAAAHNWRLLPEAIVKAYDSALIVFRPDAIDIKTLKGTMTAGPTDWIIQGVHGELYPCKNDIFQATYDVA